MNDVRSILLVGVGGQGTILVSKLLTQGLIRAGYDVKMSEVHGMAQRGGSVSTQVRYGKKVYSPIIDTGEADLIVSFEKIEAARWLADLKPEGVIVVNTQQVDPMPVIIGAAEYPSGVLPEMEAAGANIDAVDALTLAEQAGSAKAANIVLMGRVAKYFDIPYEKWIAAIEKTVAPKFVELNKRAFELGYQA